MLKKNKKNIEMLLHDDKTVLDWCDKNKYFNICSLCTNKEKLILSMYNFMLKNKINADALIHDGLLIEKTNKIIFNDECLNTCSRYIYLETGYNTYIHRHRHRHRHTHTYTNTHTNTHTHTNIHMTPGGRSKRRAYGYRRDQCPSRLQQTQHILKRQSPHLFFLLPWFHCPGRLAHPHATHSQKCTCARSLSLFRAHARALAPADAPSQYL